MCIICGGKTEEAEKAVCDRCEKDLDWLNRELEEYENWGDVEEN